MKILESYRLGTLTLSNRVVMAPMTRSRARADGVPGDLAALYYTQRSSMGLIISEAINISQRAIGVPNTPGLYTTAQIEGWRKVTAAVHAQGGLIFAQLWHTGRAGHSSARAGMSSVAPSAIRIEGQQSFTSDGPMDFEVPHALTLDEIKEVIFDYRHAALNARMAGFDGVELHAAFGYLPNQFLVDGANHRTDSYGGSIANRARFTLEVLQALIEVWGDQRVGIKLSPSNTYNGMIDSNPEALYEHLITALNELPLAYLQLMQPMFPLDEFPDWPRDTVATYSRFFSGTVIANGGYTQETAEEEVQFGRADLIAFGALALANPDLPARFAKGGPFNEADRATLYAGGTDKGYTDYPALPATDD
ncbi:alkene reductase [Pseudomonas gingeri]